MIPACAQGVVMVDVDGVIYPLVGLHAEPAPLPGAVEALQALHRAGYRIVIYTARLSPTWLVREGRDWQEEYAYLVRVLERDRIPWTLITAEKLPAELYIDDHGLRFTDWESALDEALDRLEPVQ